MGEKLSFYLSLGLFSSNGVDAGTRMLLKTLVKQNRIPEEGKILDAGCGTGIIAVSIKKRFPELEITAADRDALALKFTTMNAGLNKLPEKGFSTVSGLLPGSLKLPLEGKSPRFNLIISNIPAKAGNPVIKDFLQNCGLHLADNGSAAVVIVAPLADFAEQCLNEVKAEITWKETDRQYTVFHFIPPAVSRYSAFAEIYERTNKTVSGFYGLSEFDSVSYCTKITLEMLNNYGSSGKTLIWNPGTGHIPKRCSEAGMLYLAGSDLLQLKASEYNLAGENKTWHLPTFSGLTEKNLSDLDYIIAIPRTIQGAETEQEILDHSIRLLRKKGKLLVAGRSSEMARVERNKKGFLLKHSIKYRGFRALMLEKQ